MSASNVDNAATPRQVACQTLENTQVPVDLDVLRLSRTFKKMYDDLGLEEHDVFPGVFPVETVSSLIFEKVIDWCKEHKGEFTFRNALKTYFSKKYALERNVIHLDYPEPVIEKECKWFEFTDYDKSFFEVPIRELLEVIKAANYLDIPRLYHYACQSVAARIKGKSPCGLCELLQQDCDLTRARIETIYADNPWLSSVPFGVRIKNAIFIPSEVLLTIFEKLPRENLERLQLVSKQFDDVIVRSSKLSEQQGPLRVVSIVEFRAQWCGNRFSRVTDLCLPNGMRVTCSDYKNLAKCLKFATVLKLRAGYGGMDYADVKVLSTLRSVKSAWMDATMEATMGCFPSRAVFEFVFTQVFLCKEITLGRERPSLPWSRRYMRLPAIAECNKLDISKLNLNGDLVQPHNVVKWLEHEGPAETKWSEPRQMILHEGGINGGIDRLLTELKTAFSESNSPKAYVVRVIPCLHHGNLDEVLANDNTHEVLRIRKGRNNEVAVERT
ncbi:S-phase kinase-associated protein 1 [Aphelenchoides avenae]|nr:S-phase kinase-associated protein 1 [Aphelenchus avenae]